MVSHIPRPMEPPDRDGWTAHCGAVIPLHGDPDPTICPACHRAEQALQQFTRDLEADPAPLRADRWLRVDFRSRP